MDRALSSLMLAISSKQTFDSCNAIKTSGDLTQRSFALRDGSIFGRPGSTRRFPEDHEFALHLSWFILSASILQWRSSERFQGWRIVIWRRIGLSSDDSYTRVRTAHLWVWFRSFITRLGTLLLEENFLRGCSQGALVSSRTWALDSLYLCNKPLIIVKLRVLASRRKG